MIEKLCPYRKVIQKKETISSLETTVTQIDTLFNFCSGDVCPFFNRYSEKNYCKKVEKELNKK